MMENSLVEKLMTRSFYEIKSFPQFPSIFGLKSRTDKKGSYGYVGLSIKLNIKIQKMN